MAGPQLVIVALPREDDPVRKFSSEKEPHLTLLYLGQPGFDADQLTHVTDYVEHAASALNQFMLEVVDRGELGPNKADVLFFNKTWSRSITNFRTQLLQDPLISTAYNNTDQFPDWSPHLTMGFPATPAKKDDRDFAGFSFVNFDRIALWTSDSAGPTFDLKQHDFDGEMAMSQIEKETSAALGVLEHHGVKGMKWGVRRSDPSGGGSGSSSSGGHMSEDVKSVVAARDKISAGGTSALSNQELQSVITRMNLETQYKTLTTTVHKSQLDEGLKTTQKILKVGATIENVRKFMGTPTGQAVKTGLTGAFAAAKFAAAANSGGASAAASVGAEIALRRAANHFTNVGR